MLKNAYRVAYVLVLLIFAGNALRGLAGSNDEKFYLYGVLLSSVALASAAAASVFTNGVGKTAVVTLTVFWFAAFLWFAWFYSGSPFIQHETHAFDAANAASEHERFLLESLAIFTALALWFISFPLTTRRRAVA